MPHRPVSTFIGPAMHELCGFSGARAAIRKSAAIAGAWPNMYAFSDMRAAIRRSPAQSVHRRICPHAMRQAHEFSLCNKRSGASISTNPR